MSAPAITGYPQRDSAVALYRWALPYLVAERARLLIVLGLSIVAIALSLGQPLLTKEIIDGGIVGGDLAVLLRAGAGMLGIALLSPVVGFLTRRYYIEASAGILHGMREHMFMHILRLKPGSLAVFRQGDLMTRLEGDLSELQRFAVDSALSAINSVVIVAGTLIMLAVMSPTLTIVVLAVFFANSRILLALKPRLGRVSKSIREAGVALSSFLMERLAAVKHVQSHCAESRELASLRQLQRQVRERTLEFQAIGYIAGAAPNLIVSIGIVLLFVGGGWSIVDGGPLTIGILVAFATYAQRISGPLQSLSGLFVGWQRARVSAGRVFELLSHAETGRRLDADGATLPGRSIAPANGEVVADKVSFRFPGAPGVALGAISFHIGAGEKVLLKAPSGFGKSTLVDLLHGHLVPTSGTLRVSGCAPSELDPLVLRRRVAVVAQDVTVFSGTLAENLRYGRPEASDAELRAAIAAAGLSEFVARSPLGLATEVGLKGCSLSGGERQRIALARAILLRPDILVVDEGTSGLDLALETRVLSAIDAALPGATRIIVSHRPLAPESFDRIIDLESHYEADQHGF